MKIILPILFAVSLLTLAAACKKNIEPRPPVHQENCIDSNMRFCPTGCDTSYKPVCGCNGKTYRNPCDAMEARVKSWTPGACGKNH